MLQHKELKNEERMPRQKKKNYVTKENGRVMKQVCRDKGFYVVTNSFQQLTRSRQKICRDIFKVCRDIKFKRQHSRARRLYCDREVICRDIEFYYCDEG